MSRVEDFFMKGRGVEARRYGKQIRRMRVLITTLCLCTFLLGKAALSIGAEDFEDVMTFDIKGFVIEGNTVLEEAEMYPPLKLFAGPDKNAADVERARDALEEAYHREGYPTVLVNIPEQTVEDGLVRLAVIESRIRRVKVTGNRFFTAAKIRDELPAFAPGGILYVPDVQADLGRVNRNSDFKVAPVLAPGPELGAIDVELKVKDRLPLHGSLEVNNRNTHDTSDLRLNAMIRYDNLWQKEHSVSFQFQTSPQDLDEVRVVAGSYVFPTPWHPDHLVALYGVWSDSDTAFGEGFEVLGKGNLYGLRYVIPLAPYGLYSHNITFGLDYKDFEETLGFGEDAGGEPLKTPITYLPLSLAYSASLPDSTGMTQFSVSLNLALRGLVTDPREFEVKRYLGKGNYLYATLGAERTQKLPYGLGLFLKLDGQIADQPLISNEQYSAGGMESVRGYKESEALGDNALHGTCEFLGPDLGAFFGLKDRLHCLPYLFYDIALLETKEPLPGQDRRFRIAGAGAGLRGSVTQHMEYELDWAMALEDTDRIEKGDDTVYFKLKFAF